LKFGLFCSCLADSPPVGRGRSAWSLLARRSSCSSLVLERRPFDLFFQPSSVVGGLVDGQPRFRGQSARSELVVDGPRCLHGWSVIVGAVLEIWELFLDGPSQPHRQSA
jgi:hypothetical protein